MRRVTLFVCLLLPAFVPLSAKAQSASRTQDTQDLKAVDPDEANEHLIKHVDPQYLPLAQQARVGSCRV
jgi:hypothetical protein